MVGKELTLHFNFQSFILVDHSVVQIKVHTYLLNTSCTLFELMTLLYNSVMIVCTYNNLFLIITSIFYRIKKIIVISTTVQYTLKITVNVVDPITFCQTNWYLVTTINFSKITFSTNKEIIVYIEVIAISTAVHIYSTILLKN